MFWVEFQYLVDIKSKSVIMRCQSLNLSHVEVTLNISYSNWKRWGLVATLLIATCFNGLSNTRSTVIFLIIELESLTNGNRRRVLTTPKSAQHCPRHLISGRRCTQHKTSDALGIPYPSY